MEELARALKRNEEEVQTTEEQPFFDCQWDEKEETKGKTKKKKARRKEGQISIVKGGGQEEEGLHIYKEEKQKQRAM